MRILKDVGVQMRTSKFILYHVMIIIMYTQNHRRIVLHFDVTKLCSATSQYSTHPHHNIKQSSTVHYIRKFPDHTFSHNKFTRAVIGWIPRGIQLRQQMSSELTR